MIDYRLYTFIKLYEKLSYTKTAEELNLTQPTITGHIKVLEEHYHCKLFVWNGRTLRSTEEADKLYRYTLSLVANEETLQRELSENKSESPLHIGATKSAALTLLTPYLAKWMALHPERTFLAQMGNTKDLLEQLDHHELDVAIIEGYFPKEDYSHFLLTETPFIGVVSSEHELAKAKTLQWEDLRNYNLFLREKGSGSREILEDMLKKHALNLDNFKHVNVVSHMSIIKQLLLTGQGFSFLYKDLVQEELTNGKLVELNLRDNRERRSIHIVYLKNSLNESLWKELFNA